MLDASDVNGDVLDALTVGDDSTNRACVDRVTGTSVLGREDLVEIDRGVARDQVGQHTTTSSTGGRRCVATTMV